MKKLFLLLIAASLSCLAQSADTPAPKITYIKAGRLFDATSDTIRTNIVIVVEGERIKSIGSANDAKIPAAADVIDLSSDTVLPGLIDCHTHLGARADRYNPIYDFRDTPFIQPSQAWSTRARPWTQVSLPCATWARRRFSLSTCAIQSMKDLSPDHASLPRPRDLHHRWTRRPQ